MKAIFLNNGYQVGRVYSERLQGEMEAQMELYPDVIRQNEMGEHLEGLQSAEAVFSTWGMPALSGEEIKRYLPNLKVVFYGAGSVQGFARPFLSAGIRVCSAWAANAEAVADFTASVIRLSLKGFFPAQQMARTDWNAARLISERHPGCHGSVVGLLGLGQTGRRTAERLMGSDLRIIAYDPYAPAELFEKLGARRAKSLEDVFVNSDIVSNHIANLRSTREILRYEHFCELPEYGVFINTGRGAQVHVPGLVQAFTEVPTRTAFFDVTDPDEPPAPGNALLTLPNAYFTPHIAGATGREVQRMGEYMLEECGRYLRGEPLKWEVTGKMLETMA
jgi:phosphoglycerate dehydrogenase-like enzyme